MIGNHDSKLRLRVANLKFRSRQARCWFWPVHEAIWVAGRATGRDLGLVLCRRLPRNQLLAYSFTSYSGRALRYMNIAVTSSLCATIYIGPGHVRALALIS